MLTPPTAAPSCTPPGTSLRREVTDGRRQRIDGTTSRRRRRDCMRCQSVLTALFLLGLSSAGACSCDEDTLNQLQPGICDPGFECSQGFTYRLGECRVARCQEDTDCCPGQRCSAAAGLCVNQWTACSDDSECVEVPGQACIDFRGGQYCGYPNRTNTLSSADTQACDGTSECAPGVACVGRRCVIAAPCEGGCPNNQVCDIDSNTCFELQTCEAECLPGQMLVVADPDIMSADACCQVECACVTLPPVAEGQFGWHASLVASPVGAEVAAYDVAYGDLVVARFDSSGAYQGVEYVDGFPTEGPISADPTGRRGGRTDPGPTVGEYASMRRDSAGRLHIAYYDRTQRALKYALRAGPEGSGWQSYVVDANGDVGGFTSLALDFGGRPRIAYMVFEGLDEMTGASYTALRYAQAIQATPAGTENWLITEVERKPLVPRGEDDFDDLPNGTGLFASLVLTSTGSPIIAYYDRVEGDLRLAQENGSGAFRVRTLDGNNPLAPTDVGAHVSAALDANNLLALAYMDYSNDDLIYLEPASGLREVVDNGVSPPDLRMVGADAALLFDRTGAPTIAYQDATRLDLVYAQRGGTPPMWSTEVIRGGSDGAAGPGAAAGFYATQDQSADQTYVGSVAVGFDIDSRLDLSLSVDIRR